jgi:hypothetical protein
MRQNPTRATLARDRLTALQSGRDLAAEAAARLPQTRADSRLGIALNSLNNAMLDLEGGFGGERQVDSMSDEQLREAITQATHAKLDVADELYARISADNALTRADRFDAAIAERREDHGPPAAVRSLHAARVNLRRLITLDAPSRELRIATESLNSAFLRAQNHTGVALPWANPDQAALNMRHRLQ